MKHQRILLIGGGGREHALAISIAKSPLCDKLYISPGNPGTAACGENIPLNLGEFNEILDFIRQNDITLCVIGPEKLLVDGLTDFLESDGISVFGPSAAAAQLEGSKSFAKEIMQKYDIPTAGYMSFEKQDGHLAHKYIEENEQWPTVLKADGLAAGKGVFICENKKDALEALESLQNDPSLSVASAKLIIEEFMEGEEVSVFAVSDGETSKILFQAQDHKRIGEGDTGPNTGGMGAYGPAPLLNDDTLAQIDETIIKPTIRAMAKEGNPYKGILYAGLMMTAAGPKVVEYNCRFGDPECQVILPALKTDIIEIMLAAANGNLEKVSMSVDKEYFTCVVLASAGYPGAIEKGHVITGIPEATDDTFVYHAGTSQSQDGTLITNGGRVLNVVAKGDTLRKSIENAYSVIESIHFKGMYYRRDIGKKGLDRLSR